MSRKLTALPHLLVLALLLGSCTGAVIETSVPTADPALRTTNAATKAPPSQTPTDRTPAPTATQAPEYRWAQLLGQDDIKPIYNPEFVSADEADYADDELIIGIEIDGRAKADPIGLLNQREMVNDELAGIPILVTW